MSTTRRGGVPARRAIARWAWRLFRREWRQQVLVLALVTVAVAVAVGGVAAAYSMAPRRDAEFGAADHRLVFDVSGAGPGAVDTYLTAAEGWFDAIDPVGQGRVLLPGSSESLALRSQDPAGPLGARMLRMREGRFPAQPGEVAVTDEVAVALRAAIGGTITLAGQEFTVVGLVENPYDLGDEFALLPPSSTGLLDSLVVFVAGSDEQARSFPEELEPGPGYIENRGSSENGTAAAGALAASAVLLLLVCLIAASGFTVVAQRRLRQLGMLAATGATPGQLRAVMVINGAVVGAIASVIGGVVGMTGWFVVAPRVEAAAHHRIDRFDLPWSLVGLAMLLAVGAATAAAWWPARTVARVPVTRALSGRPPAPARTHRSLVLALVLLGGGVASLQAGIDATEDEAANAQLAILGALAIPLGLVVLAPLAIRTLGPAAARLPVTARLALRDLARYQARAGAALSAVSLGLGITVAVVVAAAAAEYRPDEGNLSDRQLMVRVDVPNEVGSLVSVPDLTPDQLAQAQTTVDEIAATLDDPAVVALNVARDPDAEEPRNGETLRPPVGLARPVGDVYRLFAPLYVATSEAIAYVGVDSESVEPNAEVLSPHPGPLYYVDAAVPAVPVRGAATIDVPAYTGAPRAFITPQAVERRGWESVPAAWLVEAHTPLTSDQLADARDQAATAGLFIEARRGQEGLSHLRSAATGAGLLLALGIVATTVGLVRSEASSDLRTLTAVGASRRTRRAVTATTAGTLALLGALLGTAGAYLGLGAGYADDLAALRPVPVQNVLAIVVGLPLVAAATAWLLAGTEPSVLTRQPIE